MKYLPISLLIEDSPCLVVGGGSVALRKSKYLVEAGAMLTIIALEFSPEFSRYAKEVGIKLIEGKFDINHLDGKVLVIAATDDQNVNQAIATKARALGILVNVVDQPKLCNFTMPSVLDRMPLSIAISSGGASPVLVRMIREKLEWMIPQKLAELARNAGDMRDEVAKQFPEFSTRRQFWENYFESALGWNISQNIAGSGLPISLDSTAIEYQSQKELFKSFNASKAKLILIDLGEGELDYLPLKSIQSFHKIEDVYFEESCPKTVQLLFRRDAEKYCELPMTLSTPYILDKLMAIAEDFDKSNKTIAFVKIGHTFEDEQEVFLQKAKALAIPLEIVKAIRA